MKRATTWASPDYRASDESGAVRKVDYEAPLPGWLRNLDYKVSGETGALKVPIKIRIWHTGWGRSGATYVTGYAGAKLPRRIIHYRWRRLMAEVAAGNTDE